MFKEIKTLLVEKNIECPNCTKELSIGNVMYKDEYRNDYFCPFCEDDYKSEVLLEEGENGELLK